MRSLIKTQIATAIIILGLGVSTLCAQQLKFSGIKGASVLPHASRILVDAYHQLGISVTIQEMPAKRALVLSNTGETDGEVYRISNIHKKWTNLIMIPIVIYYNKIVVITKNEDFSIEGWESIRPYKIGIVRGVLLYEENTKGMKVRALTHTEQVYRSLNYDRVDIVVDSLTTALKSISKFELSNLRIMEPHIDKFAVYHYLHKRHKDLLPRITQILRKMEDTGEIKKRSIAFENSLRQ